MLAQIVLLGGLAVAVGVAPFGWLACGLWAVLGYVVLLPHADRLGPASRVTLARAVLIGGVIALVVDGSHAELLAILAAVALALDAVDGVVARRTGTVSALGARFDMEADAALLLALSVAAVEQVGLWVLAIGLMRYVFAAAGAAAPWLRAGLPFSRSRKVVAAWQGVTLAVVVSRVCPDWLATAGAALSLALLTWSFARDTVWLHRRRSDR